MNPNLSLLANSVDMNPEFVAAVVITGLVLTFVCLIVLILFVQFLGKLVSKVGKKKPLNQAGNNTPSAPAATPKASAAVAADGIEEEVVAVITAAIAAMSAQSGKQLVLRSITKAASPARKPWALAGLQENTRPF